MVDLRLKNCIITVMIRSRKKKTVFCMMSGGVDSSTAAALLKKKGYHVVGCYLKNWTTPFDLKQADGCSWVEDAEIVRRVCRLLDVPFYTFSFEAEYKKRVVEEMIRGYRKGITPNPDIECNRLIKFGLFLEKALSLGADLVATGHYARIKRSPTDRRKFQLLAGVDGKKDQSYFLWRLNQEMLSRVLFPIGEYKKSDVRKIARRFSLPNADRPDSQGICFVGRVEIKEFLSRYIKPRPGSIYNTEGDCLGEHDGAYFYTPGQRRGLGIGGGIPYYIVKKDILTNTLVVAPGRNSPELYKNEVVLRDVNWLAGAPFRQAFSALVRIRYQQPLQRAEVSSDAPADADGKLRLKFKKPQWAPAAGQSAVIYDGKVLLGGGIIQQEASSLRL